MKRGNTVSTRPRDIQYMYIETGFPYIGGVSGVAKSWWKARGNVMAVEGMNGSRGEGGRPSKK